MKKRREALCTFVVGKSVFVRTLPTGFGQSLLGYALIPLVFDVLQGGESDRRSVVIVVSPLTSLMMEQRAQSTTHSEVCRRATTGSRHNGKRQGRKKCTVLARRWISSGLRCYLEESTALSSRLAACTP